MDSQPGSKTLHSFFPGWTDPELLERTLVGRRELVDRLEELAIDGAGGPNKHQRLLVGPRGSGKTHVLRVLHNRLRRNEALKQRLLVVPLLEDELGVATFLDFLVRLLRAIERWYPGHAHLASALEELCDLPPGNQEPRAVQLLLQTVADKDVLILTENLGITFDNVKGFGRRGQQALRDFLQRYPRFMIFASSQALVEGARDPDAPFFGFFKIIHLSRLSVEQAMELLVTIASAYHNQEAVEFLRSPRGRGRMRSIYEYTGGNHRLLVVFYEFLTADSLVRLSEPFMQALNLLRPFYQEQMRGLSAQQQKIVQFLCLQRTPRTVKDVARACLAAPNTVSSQLKDLLDKNFVSRNEEGRESYYEVTEALFRVCHEAELEQEGAPVRLFVNFLANLYTAEELRLRHRGLAALAGRLGSRGPIPFAEEARFYWDALSLHARDPAQEAAAPSAGPIEPEDDLRSVFSDMQQSGAYREIIRLARYLGEEKDAFILHTEAMAHLQVGDVEQAVSRAKEALSKDPDDVESHLVLAAALDRRPETRDAALEHARRASDLAPDDPRGLTILGGILGSHGDHVEALKHSECLTERHPKWAGGWWLKAIALVNLRRTQEAEAMYRKALELDPANADALEQLGILVATTGRYEEALARFQLINMLRPSDSVGWSLTARALESLGRAEEAEAAWRRALELDPTEARAWARLSSMLERFGRGEEAATAFQRAIENGADKAELLNSCGEVRRQRGEYARAIQDYEESLRADPNGVWPHFNVVSALLGLGRVEEAVNRLPAAIEADQRSKDPCGGLVTQSFHENCVALFEHSPPDSFPRFLTALLDLARGQGAACMERFEQSLPLTTFALLRDHERIGEERFNHIIQALEDVVGKRIETSVAVRLLRVGVDYFKKTDRKALLRLAREERRVFCRELGIEAVEG